METSAQNLIIVFQVKIIKLIFIFAAAVVVAYFLKVVVSRATNKVTERRIKTILSLVNNTIAFAVLVIVSLMVLDEFGINIAPLLVSAGIVGVAIGYGSQNLVRDIINGLFLLSEDQLREGDMVKINNSQGTVEKISLKSVLIRDIDGGLHIISNSDIGTVTNLSRDWSQANLLVGVASKQKIDDVIPAFERAADDLMQHKQTAEFTLEKPEIAGIDDIQGGKVIIKIKIRTKPKKQFNVARQYRYFLKKAFEEKGLEFA